MIKILIVDDEIDTSNALKNFLKKRNYDVLVAYNGNDALQKVKMERPHAVILDIVMPDMNGVDVLKKIKEIDKEVGVIMVTGLDDVETARECMKLGAHDYITKPFDLDYLETSLLTKIVNMLG